MFPKKTAMIAPTRWLNLSVNIFILILVCFVSTQIACREIEEPTASDDSYFPISIGNTWIYAVDSIHYDGFKGDSAKYVFERKEEITSLFLVDSSKQNAGFILQISVRNDSNQLWQYIKSSIVQKDDYRAVRKDFNIPRVKLVFPIKDRKSWDANQLNSKEINLVRFRNVGDSHIIGERIFTPTLKVDEYNESYPSSESICWEIYADNTGLIEKYYSKFTIEDDKKQGSRYHWKLKSFSN